MLEFVPEGITDYAIAHTTPEPIVLKELAATTRARTDEPEMLVGPLEGTFLKLVVRATAAKRVLEIGTFTGYSALMMAEGLADDGQVITCDIDPESTKIARSYWAQSPHGHKIRLELGPAKKTLETIDGPLDLVFIDADKESYITYWDACVPKVRQGGVILVDNVLWSGRVLDPREPVEHAIVAFNEHVQKDARVERVVLPFRDGITMAVKQ